MDEVLILGCLMIAACVVIQCVVVSVLLRVLLVLERRQLVRTTLIRTSGVLIAVTLIMLGGNLVQVALWASLFVARGEFHDFGTAFYHSAVNLTTLGYGDIVMHEGGRLLGALEAANGVVMFGLTTSVLFVVLHELMSRAWGQRLRGDS
jgi:hypothetical protein